MQVLMLMDECPWPPNQGDKIRNWGILRALSQFARVDLVIMQPITEEARDRLKQYCATVESFFEKHTILKYMYGILNLRAPVTSAIRRSSRTRKKLNAFVHSKYIDGQHYDVLWGAQLKTAWYVHHLQTNPQLSQTKFVLDLCDALSLYRRRMAEQHSGSFWKWLNRFEAIRLARYEGRLITEMDLSFVASAIDRDSLRLPHTESKIAVLPNGVDGPSGEESLLRKELNRNDQSKKTILFVGNMNYPPNRDAIEWFGKAIWPIVRSKRREMNLNIVGSGAPEWLKKEPNVSVKGYVPNLEEEYECSDVVISPVRFGAGTRLKIIEAMMNGKPIVSTTLGAEGIGAEHGKHMLFADTPEAFAKAIMAYVDDEEYAYRCGNDARESAMNNFSWEIIGLNIKIKLDELQNIKRAVR
ncbi:glycosyltransferase [Heliobacterium gestii]|uniref:Glycosyltransferase n=1 Tax=Heliomicrobium gestii TaxID=2699 RepID=A0A845LC26_HELGE|nr:glycosyltransferase [Heliomicrobium gestii]MBM7866599.1 glycosyltransferase involved in cell wall biosynthesis [Heliomicrobium gestii]MZP43121.1 glycosyltransferase [Heliomicrobium gestii]